MNLASKNGIFLFKLLFMISFFSRRCGGLFIITRCFGCVMEVCPLGLKCVFLHNKRNPKTHRESHDYDCGFPCSPFQAYYLMMACCGRTFCFDAVSRLNNQCLPDLCRGRCISGGSLSVFGSTFPPRWAVFWLSVCSA